MQVIFKHFWMSGVWAPPAVIEAIIANRFPMLYLAKPVEAQELISKVEGAILLDVAKDFPRYLVKEGRTSELKSKWRA